MAEESNDGQEKTEQATPKREKESRDEGTVARSRELNTMLSLILAAITMIYIGPNMLQGLSHSMQFFFRLNPSVVFDHRYIPLAMSEAIGQGVGILAPFLLIMFVITLTAPLSLGGWSLSSKAMGFKWNRLDPIKGFGRLFAWRSIMELLKALAKFALITSVASWFIWNHLDAVITLGSGDVFVQLSESAKLIIKAFLFVSSATVLLALVDVPFQLWDHAKKLRMTKQEIKEEMKQTEGRPEVKSRIRQLQYDVATQKMMLDVPEADVIVTNPTHYAIALKYDPDTMVAPVLVAKGVDEIAARIREVGEQHEITMLRTPPLARALFHSTKIGAEIPEGLYLAAAQVLAYVYQLKRYTETDELPVLPVDLPIPDELYVEGAS